jgi:hypothetical protein
MQYTKNPVTIEAIQFNGNFDEIERFVGGDAEFRNGELLIATLEGPLRAAPKDFIIKGIKGEFYPCKPDIFEKTYSVAKSTGDFGWALARLKEGKAVQRSGWNGKGMYLYLVPANNYPPVTEHARREFGDMVPYGAYIAMKTAQNNVVPWLASQTDVLSEDWLVIE